MGRGDTPAMIHDVVVHLNNEQPLLADLDAVPLPTDVALVCTNLRTMNGSRPVFVADSRSRFVFPLQFIRFVEIPPGSIAGAVDDSGDAGRRSVAGSASPVGPEEPITAEAEIEIDEEFLRRIRDA